MSVHQLLVVLAAACVITAQKDLGIFFLEEPQSKLVSPGEEVVLTCATNLVVEHLGWLRDWRPLEPGSSDASMEVEPGRLRFRVSTEPEQHRKQAAEYRCMAWLGPIGLASLPAVMNVAHLEPFSARPNTSLVAPPGGSALLHCTPPESVPPAEVAFYRDGEPLPPDGDSHQQLSGGRLLLSRLSENQAGRYSCTASNSRSRQQVAAPFVTRLEVGRGRSETERPPRLLVPPETVYFAAAGDTVSLDCAAEGWPAPRVTWRRQDGRWSDRYTQRPAGLRILRAQPSDQGRFVCQTDSAAGSVTAVTELSITEPPSVETSPADLSVPEGATAELHCSGRGRPPPQLLWVLNGRPVLPPEQDPRPVPPPEQHPLPKLESEPGLKSGQLPSSDGPHLRRQQAVLRFKAVRRQDAGLYQCFGHSAGGDAKAAVLLKVIPRRKVSREGPSSAAEAPPAPRRSTSRHPIGQAVMVPPGAPAVYPISRSSVMLQWTVPPNDGLSVLFFKIQYRRTPRRRHGWHTVDSDVPGTASSFEVTGLKLGAKYKFRVLAVYENKDNKHGPNSRTVKMTALHERARPPGSPTIAQHWSLNSSAIRCSWAYYNLQSSPIEGYFIYYRDTTTAGDYSKVTVLGETTKTYTLTALQPATAYDIKVQAFNKAGGVSAFSDIVTEATSAAADVSVAGPPVAGSDLPPSAPVVPGAGQGRSQARLHALVGGVLGGLMLLGVGTASLCLCRARNTARFCRCCTPNAGKQQVSRLASSDGLRERSVLQPPSVSATARRSAELTGPENEPGAQPVPALQVETPFSGRSPCAASPALWLNQTEHGPITSAPLNNNKSRPERRRQRPSSDSESGFETECLTTSPALS